MDEQPESLKWRCQICRQEFVSENPPTYFERAKMQLHVSTHKAADYSAIVYTEQTKEGIEIAILERWYQLIDPR